MFQNVWYNLKKKSFQQHVDGSWEKMPCKNYQTENNKEEDFIFIKLMKTQEKGIKYNMKKWNI